MRWTLADGSTFVGNDAAKAQLSARLSGGAFPHAILIEGPVGSGRRTVATLIAAAALCESEDRPCGVCPACRKVLAGIHPDVTYHGGEGEARSFHIDEIRRVREDAYVRPNEGMRRVFVLLEAQNMSPQAQNALLKLLEEPPAQVVLILTCEQRTALLETVLSRVFPVALSGVPAEQAAAVLRRHLPDRDEQELLRAATLWGGVIGQALKGLQDGSYKEILGLLPPLASGLVAPAELDLLKATAPLEKNKAAVGATLDGLRLILRDALCARYGADSFLGTDSEVSRLLARGLTGKQLLDLIAVVEEMQVSRRFNMNHTLFLTTLCSRLRRAAGR